MKSFIEKQERGCALVSEDHAYPLDPTKMIEMLKQANSDLRSTRNETASHH